MANLKLDLSETYIGDSVRSKILKHVQSEISEYDLDRDDTSLVTIDVSIDSWLRNLKGFPDINEPGFLFDLDFSHSIMLSSLDGIPQNTLASVSAINASNCALSTLDGLDLSQSLWLNHLNFSDNIDLVDLSGLQIDMWYADAWWANLNINVSKTGINSLEWFRGKSFSVLDLHGCAAIKPSHFSDLGKIKHIFVDFAQVENLSNAHRICHDFGINTMTLNGSQVFNLKCEQSKLHEHDYWNGYLQWRAKNQPMSAYKTPEFYQSNVVANVVSTKLNNISDPFEFQDWCIAHGLEDFL
jgi:hypothetical protein